MKIFQLTPFLIPGAASNVVTISKELKKNGNEVFVFATKEQAGFKSQPELINILKKYDIPWIDIPLFRRYTYLISQASQKLSRFIEIEKPDIIHTHAGIPTIVALNAVEKLNNIKIPIITTIHGWSPQKKKYQRKMDISAINQTDKVIAVSNGIKEEMEKQGIKKSLIVRIYYGFDENYFKKFKTSEKIMTKKKLRINDSDIIIASIGNLVPLKGHKFLIKAIQKLEKKYKHIKLLILGDGPCRSKLTESCKKQIESGTINFLGKLPQKNVIDILSLTDIYVQPSLYDASPFSVLEAMNIEKPVIGTDVGGIPELIENKVTGLIVPHKNSKALLEAIAILVEDSEKRLAMGIAGARKVKEKFSVETMMSELEKCYHNL